MEWDSLEPGSLTVEASRPDYVGMPMLTVERSEFEDIIKRDLVDARGTQSINTKYSVRSK